MAGVGGGAARQLHPGVGPDEPGGEGAAGRGLDARPPGAWLGCLGVDVNTITATMVCVCVCVCV